MTQTHSNGTCVIQNCLMLWVHPTHIESGRTAHLRHTRFDSYVTASVLSLNRQFPNCPSPGSDPDFLPAEFSVTGKYFRRSRFDFVARLQRYFSLQR